ncbi:MAG: hypothetical protein RIS92_1571 [Verrucomicrobiota bacterium]|jgi:hypothetical protein
MNPQTAALIPRATPVLQSYIIAAETFYSDILKNKTPNATFHSPTTKSELRAINRGLGRTPINRIILAALFGLGGMLAIRQWRNTPFTTANSQSNKIKTAVDNLRQDLHDLQWLTENQAEDMLRSTRPHTTDEH